MIFYTHTHTYTHARAVAQNPRATLTSLCVYPDDGVCIIIYAYWAHFRGKNIRIKIYGFRNKIKKSTDSSHVEYITRI